jgi:hypothetical protein
MTVKNVTGYVTFHNNDDEDLSITRCMCGATFPGWEFIIGVYQNRPTECPECNRKLFFSFQIQVYEVTE